MELLRMNYVHKIVGGKFVVWIDLINRYIIFDEIAFEIFQKLAQKNQYKKIENFISEKYNLSSSNTHLLVKKINSNLQNLFNPVQKQKKPFEFISEKDIGLVQSNDFEKHTYRIFDKNIIFSYSGNWMRDLIHPSIKHLEIKSVLHTDANFVLYNSGDKLVLNINNTKKITWNKNEQGFFKGSVLLQLLNNIYKVNTQFWLGVFHASAVVKGGKAILILAAGGTGKSTLAALLCANGFELISDDFVPICLPNTLIYSVPSAHSVKEGGINVLKNLYPGINDLKIQFNSYLQKKMIFVPPLIKQKQQKVKVEAIIFPEFNKECIFKGEKADNLIMLNNIVRETWIANNEECARAFLDWYFEIPCYTLKYSNNGKAINFVNALIS